MKFKRVISSIHKYSSLLMIGSLLIYIITGYLMTRHNMWQPVTEKVIHSKHALNLPDSLTNDDLPYYLQEKFGLSGHRGKPQLNNNKSITVLYSKPGIKHQVVVSPDKTSIAINSTIMNLRSVITAFHRIKGYGGGSAYDAYILMTDLTALCILVFSLSGLYLSLTSGKEIIYKLLALTAGVAFTVIIIISFLRS